MSPNAMAVCEWTHNIAAAVAFNNNAAAAPPMFEPGCCSTEPNRENTADYELQSILFI